MRPNQLSRVPGEGLVAARGPHHVVGETGPLVGVLALQGDVLEHLRMLADAGARAVPVKRAEELDDLDGVLIPGGESTTIGKLAVLYGLLEPLRKRLREGLPAFGTCAGAILLSRQALSAQGEPSEQPLLDVMDTVVRRNAFGRQVRSFEADLTVAGLDGGPLHAVFIRAPWFEELGEGVEALAAVPGGHEPPGAGGHESLGAGGHEPSGAREAGARVVVARQGALLACAFHPELADDSRLHRLFVDIVKES